MYGHAIPIKWYSEYLKNSKIMSNFSRDTMIMMAIFYTTVAMCAVLWVCSIFQLFFCAMNMNDSIVSITAPESKHGKLIV